MSSTFEGLPQVELADNLPILEQTDFPELGKRRQGKVRDVYKNEDRIIMIATDRFSAFNRNLALVPFKGQVSTQVSRFWFEQTQHIIPNHMIDTPDPSVMVCERGEIFPVEFVIRAHMTGSTDTSMWMEYQAGKREFGELTLPDGMHYNQRLSRPVVTPTTKSEHDRSITAKEIVESGLMDEETWRYLRSKSIELFSFGQAVAFKRGLRIVDTKFEFIQTPDGQIKVADEVLTPDSSRYWLLEDYTESVATGSQPNFYDKEFMRLWFDSQEDFKNKKYDKQSTPPAPPPDVINELSRRYIVVYERLTGQQFVPDLSDPQQRIARNLNLNNQNQGEL